ncbi:efflux RND transporter periplasmic adaptor subunit [Methylolobus aquaticus]|nr:efflux RND transporter periplasmic adaptor subunit [Methylolobus aquaticus]
MKTSRAVLLATAALALGLLLGYGLERIQQRDRVSAVEGTSSERKPLYYRHPMNPAVTSDRTMKDEMGMDYLPVYAEEGATDQARTQRRVLHYRNPMDPSATSPTPKKDSMGMDYLAVYEGETDGDHGIRITPEKIQKLGVRTEAAAPRRLSQRVRAVGTVVIDERRQHVVTPRFEGWIKRLYVNVTGQHVQRGQALLDVYSPEVLTAEEEYLIAAKGRRTLRQAGPQSRTTAEQLTESALQRLRLWQIPERELQRLQAEGTSSPTVTLAAPGDGAVLDKPAVEGMRFMPGELLFRIADLSTVWLLADVFEQDLGAIRQGQTVTLHVNAYPGKQFRGRVAFVYPTLSAETRTGKVRIELPNPAGLLKPAMYGSVELEDAGHRAGVTVPDSAVLDSGTRQVVLVRHGEDTFEPRTVRLGQQGDGYVELLSGVRAGENVVVGANFLIDAESNLKAALRGMGGREPPAESSPSPAGVNSPPARAAPPAHPHGAH